MGSSSKSSQASSNADNRIANQDGFVLQNSSGNSISVTDGGAVSRALDSADRASAWAISGMGAATANALQGMESTTVSALSFADMTNKGAFQIVDSALDYSNDNFSKLLDVGESMFNQSQGLIGQTQKAVADAYGQAQNDKAGTIDNRTIIVLAVAGAAALVVMNRKG